jgi:hypothetical protein
MRAMTAITSASSFTQSCQVVKFFWKTSPFPPVPTGSNTRLT